jgi:hypothetical protein
VYSAAHVQKKTAGGGGRRVLFPLNLNLNFKAALKRANTAVFGLYDRAAGQLGADRSWLAAGCWLLAGSWQLAAGRSSAEALVAVAEGLSDADADGIQAHHQAPSAVLYCCLGMGRAHRHKRLSGRVYTQHRPQSQL